MEKIIAPIGLEDPYQILGISSPSGDYNLGYITGAAAKDRINVLSKYKPVRYPQPFTDNYPNWWKAANGNCGIAIASYREFICITASLVSQWLDGGGNTLQEEILNLLGLRIGLDIIIMPQLYLKCTPTLLWLKDELLTALLC